MGVSFYWFVRKAKTVSPFSDLGGAKQRANSKMELSTRLIQMKRQFLSGPKAITSERRKFADAETQDKLKTLLIFSEKTILIRSKSNNKRKMKI